MNTSSNDGSCSRISNWEEGSNSQHSAAGNQKRIIHKILRRAKPEGPRKSTQDKPILETRSQPAFNDHHRALEVERQVPRSSRDLKYRHMNNTAGSQFVATNGVCEFSGRDPTSHPTAPVENVKETSTDHSSKKSLAERQTAYFEARRRIFEGRETSSYSQEYENAVDSEDFDVPPMTAPPAGFYTPEYFGSTDCHEFYTNHHGPDSSTGLSLHPPVAYTAVPQGIHTVHHSWSCYWPHHPHEESSPHPRHA